MTNFSGDLNLKATELRLGLPGTEEMEREESHKRGLKRVLSEVSEDCKSQSINEESMEKETNHVAKMQIVGWPPIRSYRKNLNKERKTEGDNAGVFVKVSMDGAPYLRKIDLKAYRCYPELLKSLVNMFKCFNIGEYCHGSEYVVTYVDKDGDWMLAGDVPWSMFVSSCKRLRIMKGTEARGLHPLA